MLNDLIYMSKATNLFTKDDLGQILDESIKWNQTHGLTGMLLYIEGEIATKKEGRIIQVLEGNKEDVAYIFEKIKNDPRHGNINLLNESLIKKRNFKNWSMGFKSIILDEPEKSDNYFNLNNLINLGSSFKDFNVPRMYMQSFYELHTVPKA